MEIRAKHLSKIYLLPSFYFFLLFLLFCFLQVIPVLNFLITILGGAFIGGLLIELIFISMFFEACLGMLPRIVAIIPLGLLGLYCAKYYQQAQQIADLEATLQQTNHANVYAFNPEREALVVENGENFITKYRIPVAYSKSGKFEEGYVSYRLVATETCNTIPKDMEDRIGKRIVSIKASFRRGNSSPFIKPGEDLCMLSMPEKPTKMIIDAEVSIVRHPDQYNNQMGESVYILKKSGQQIGEYRTAAIYRYTKFPNLVAGVALRNVYKGFEILLYGKQLYHLKSSPPGFKTDKGISPFALMLGLKKYGAVNGPDRVKFPEIPMQIKSARQVASYVVDAAFARLDQMFTDPKRKFRKNMRESLIAAPDRIAERSDRIIEYLDKTTKSANLKSLLAEQKKRVERAASVASDKLNQMWREEDSSNVGTVFKKVGNVEYLFVDTPKELLALKIAERQLKQLKNEYYSWSGSYGKEKRKLMLYLLAWLPEEKFSHHSAKIFEHLANLEEIDYPLYDIYLRLADETASTDGLQQWYEAGLLSGKQGDTLRYKTVAALCRGGRASQPALDFMKSTFASMSDAVIKGHFEIAYKSYYQVLFLALIKLGERDFIESTIPKLTNFSNDNWYEKILAGKADGPKGPNNCMAKGHYQPGKTPPALKNVSMDTEIMINDQLRRFD